MLREKANFPLNVLVISPRSLDFINLDAVLNKKLYCFHFLQATIQLSGFSESLDLLAYLDKCRKFICKNQIDIILSTQDIPTLIQAKLYDEFDYLSCHQKNASLESLMLCLHKYYTRQYIDLSPIPFYALDLGTDDKNDLSEIPIPLPWVVKPCTTACSAEIHKVFSLGQFTSLLPSLKERIIQGNQYLIPFFEAYCDIKKYPLLSKNTLLIEQYIPSVARCCVDGCVYDGEIIIWGISQVNSYQGSPDSMADFIFPSLLANEIQVVLRQQYINIVSQLIKYGFNRQFVNVEFFVKNDNSIELIEINGRLSPVTTAIYRDCLINGDPYKASLEMSKNQKPDTPEWNNLYGAVFYVTTFASGYAYEIMNFSVSDSLPEIELRVTPREYIQHNKDTGVSLASFKLIGNSYDDMKKKADFIRNSLLLKNLN